MKPDNLYIHTISVSRQTSTVDSGGSPVSTFAIHLSSVSCRVQPVSATEVVKAGRQWSSPTWRVYCNPSNDIAMKDIVTYESVEYEIKELNNYPNTYMELIISK